jgi:hypothetical protein
MNGKSIYAVVCAAVLVLIAIDGASAFRGGGFGGFRGGGFGGMSGGFDFHNDAPHSFSSDDFSRMPDTFNRSDFSGFSSSATSSHNYYGSRSATNAWGQTYHSTTVVHNGNVYHGATVTNPVYHGYPAWGWNGGVAWYGAPYYWGGGFWGPFAVGALTATAFGTIAYNNTTYTSYQTQASSPGAKLLSSYKLTQVPCGPSGLVVIYGPNNSVICAQPNQLVAAGNYSVNTSTLTIVSEKPAST